MISSTFFFEGNLYIVVKTGDIYRLRDNGSDAPANWTFEIVTNNLFSR